MRRVIGIDPGISTTGFGIIEGYDDTLEVVTFGTIVSSAKKPIYDRLSILYDRICQVIQEYQPTEMAVEESFFSKNPRTALVLGQARGVILLAGAHQHIKCFEYTPRKIKMSVVGSGAASKEQVQFMVKSILKLDEHPSSFDITDALATGMCHLNQMKLS
ncbi:MAG: crossover junction endodeoxyribonuclease RuvC [Candidatus Marinimicrobia bacterium]|nr:crossover junction endodeoxyribonuclease RuvC [Candidatus Neomarinimicrobiota bacterium]MBL7047282.1 crossover junction endodeoxyribonuclease RuvC [Candidatus Neomarinimicrobiota bacterium]